MVIESQFTLELFFEDISVIHLLSETFQEFLLPLLVYIDIIALVQLKNFKNSLNFNLIPSLCDIPAEIEGLLL